MVHLNPRDKAAIGNGGTDDMDAMTIRRRRHLYIIGLKRFCRRILQSRVGSLPMIPDARPKVQT